MLPELLGCYQSQKLQKMGKTAGSGRDFTQRINWLALRLDAARILIFPLDDASLPMPLQKTVTPQEFLGHFLPAPLVFKERLAQASLVLGRLLGDGDAHLDQNALPEAERALFTVILMALSAGGHADSDGAVLAVLKGSGATAGGEAQKRTINAFGIQLRKEKNFDIAAAYYRTALEIAPDDERLLFNLARVLYEKGELAGCRDLLEKALAAAPDFPEAAKFLRHVRRREGAPAGADFPDIRL